MESESCSGVFCFTVISCISTSSCLCVGSLITQALREREGEFAVNAGGSEFAFPCNGQLLGCDDCLEDKREDCWDCSVLYCVLQQLCTVINTLI